MNLVLTNAQVVTRGEVMHGSVAIEGTRIAAVDSGSASGIDLENDLLIPGLIEVHTDNFERHLMPRPKVRWPEMPALLGHDAALLPEVVRGDG